MIKIDPKEEKQKHKSVMHVNIIGTFEKVPLEGFFVTRYCFTRSNVKRQTVS